MSATAPSLELRHVDLELEEVRAAPDKIAFVGYASVFNSRSVELGGFTEEIAKGAFKNVLASDPDVRLLFNHDPSAVLARTKNQTLELREDPKGLRVYAELAPTTLGKDLQILLKRGDISGMSFGFQVAKDSWDREASHRTVTEIAALHEVSITPFPAYVATQANARSINGAEIISPEGAVNTENLRAIARQIASDGLDLTSIEARTFIDADASTKGVADEASAGLPAREFLQLRLKVLELSAKATGVRRNG